MKRILGIVSLGLIFLAPAAPQALAGSIVGRVTYAGNPPPPRSLPVTKDKDVCETEPHPDESLVLSPDRGIANVVVYVQDPPKAPPMPLPASPPRLDQRSCRFHPHVLIVPAGGTLEVLNNDGVLHNLHTYPKNNPTVNQAQPKFRKVMPVKIEKPDVIRLSCDVHPWMSGWLVVAPHAWYALTAPDGRFRIDDVAPGSYTLATWQEALGVQTARVTVPVTGEVNAEFAYPAKP